MNQQASIFLSALGCLSFLMAALPICKSAAAEPSPSVRALMKQPVSHFSFGLYRLREHLISVYDDRRGLQLREPLAGRMPYGTLVKYDWQENRLQITILRFEGNAQNWDFEEECGQVLSSLRKEAYINLATGRPQDGLEHSGFADHFLPEGYSLPSIGPDTGAELDVITDLYFQAAHSTGSFVCGGPLLGTGHSVIRTE